MEGDGKTMELWNWLGKEEKMGGRMMLIRMKNMQRFYVERAFLLIGGNKKGCS